LIDFAFGASHLDVQPKVFHHAELFFWNNNPKLERQQNSLWGMMEELFNFTIALCFHDPCLFGYGDS
jgi:hypothetical protein